MHVGLDSTASFLLLILGLFFVCNPFLCGFAIEPLCAGNEQDQYGDWPYCRFGKKVLETEKKASMAGTAII